MLPHTAYFVCMTPRTGSTLVCDALKATGYAGQPEEYYLAGKPADLLAQYTAVTYADVQAAILQRGTSPNGVFGVKLGTGSGGGLDSMLAVLRHAAPDPNRPVPQLLRQAFPTLRYLFLTRRNKVRQAASWWKAVQTNQWVQRPGDAPVPPADRTYSFDAIDHLVQETVLREASWQAFFETVGATPFTVVYEDLVARYDENVRAILTYLGLNAPRTPPITPRSVRQADALSEAWVQRYRREKQHGWNSVGW